MCSRLNQFSSFPVLSFAGQKLVIEKKKRKAKEGKRAGREVVNNICPTDYADVLHVEDGQPVSERMRFGLIPFWARGSKTEVEKKFRATFNARCETIFDLASYKPLILRQRCLIPVRGWHEWPDRTTPYFIRRRDDQPILLAGIWTTWESIHICDEESGPIVTSMSVVTTPPGRYMGKFHDRSPLVLEGEDALAWMQPGLQRVEVEAFFKPYESRELEAWRVSSAVADPRNKTEETLAPISPPVPQEGELPPTVENPPSGQLKLF